MKHAEKLTWEQDDNYYLLTHKKFQIQISFYDEKFFIVIMDTSMQGDDTILDTEFDDYKMLEKTVCEFIDCKKTFLDMPSIKQLQAVASWVE